MCLGGLPPFSLRPVRWGPSLRSFPLFSVSSSLSLSKASLWNPYFTLSSPLFSPSLTFSIDDKDVGRQGEGFSWFSSFALSRSLWLWCHLDGEQVPWLVLQGQRDATQPSGWGADDQKLIGTPTVFPSQCSGHFPCGLRGSAVGPRPISGQITEVCVQHLCRADGEKLAFV